MQYRYLALAMSGLFLSAVTTITTADNHGAAINEASQALNLTADLERGKKVYKTCAVCHSPEGWGSQDGYYPQIAGQLPSVIIKQLSDIRARNRDNPTMYPFAMPSSLGGAQEMADVAAYISSLPVTPLNSRGSGHHLTLGAKIYQDECTECHGKYGEGDAEDHIPLIQGQHYGYLIRQFRWIQSGKRRNADKKMVKQIQRFTGRDITAVMDYVSRIKPTANKIATPDWRNPDFPKYVRTDMPDSQPADPGWEQQNLPMRPQWRQPATAPTPPKRPDWMQ